MKLKLLTLLCICFVVKGTQKRRKAFLTVAEWKRKSIEQRKSREELQKTLNSSDDDSCCATICKFFSDTVISNTYIPAIAQRAKDLLGASF